MRTFPEFSKADLAALMRAIDKVAAGQNVSVEVEEGTHVERHDGVATERPNGCITITILVNGGAVDSGDRYGYMGYSVVA